MLKEKINKVINSKVRPYLKSHGGDLEIVSIEDKIVKMKFLGQCKNCISAESTAENIIKTTLKEEIPDLEKVIVDNYTNPEILDIARKLLRKRA